MNENYLALSFRGSLAPAKQSETPLVLVTNDDGYESKGLWSTVKAVLPLGRVFVVAPDRQWSGADHSTPQEVSGQIRCIPRKIMGKEIATYTVDASPALSVIHAVVELMPHRPDLVVSGINFGANTGTEVTVSGTVGAALEAGAFGNPALGVNALSNATAETPWRLTRQSRFRCPVPKAPDRANGQGRPGDAVLAQLQLS